MNLARCRLSRKIQLRLLEFFVAEVTARSAADLLSIQANSAILFYRKLREIISYQLAQKEHEIFDGVVELDESYFGAKRHRGYHGKLKRGRSTLKQPVFGVFERDGSVYTEIVPDCKRLTLQAVILGKVSINSFWKIWIIFRLSNSLN